MYAFNIDGNLSLYQNWFMINQEAGRFKKAKRVNTQKVLINISVQKI